MDRVFTGDTLFIRGTGRTDFQHGDPEAQYNSIFNKLLILPDETLVYPGHDYKGDTVSTIAEERAFNPRLQVASIAEYVEKMNNLNLDNPKMMDVAVPANLKIGLSQDEIEARGWSLNTVDVKSAMKDDAFLLIDLRDKAERERHGQIPGSIHAPYADLTENLGSGGLLHGLASASDKVVVFYCAYGERSAMAVQAAREAGLEKAKHLKGGVDAWRKENGALEAPS